MYVLKQFKLNPEENVLGVLHTMNLKTVYEQNTPSKIKISSTQMQYSTDIFIVTRKSSKYILSNKT